MAKKDPRPSITDRTRSFAGTLVGKIVGIGALLALVAGLVLLVQFDGGATRLDNTVLSGPEQGFYYARMARLSDLADDRGGELKNLSTAGSMENLQRLVDSSESCDADFALVQNGMEWPEDGSIELIGRFPRSESLFLLGRNGDQITQFSDLQGARIGVGPEGSGTDFAVRKLLGSQEFAPLDLQLSNHEVVKQAELASTGELDLAAFVIDEDSAFIRKLVVEEGLQIAALDHLDVVARKFDFVWLGRIGAGQFDPVTLLPTTDKHVLRIDTLMISNGCAAHSETVGVLVLLQEEYPGFVAHNQEPNKTGLPYDPVAKDFFTNNGAGFVDSNFPWVIDIMPLSMWVYVVMGISVLFNLMNLGHRFRLWRLDANRFKNEETLEDLLGTGITIRDLDDLMPKRKQFESDLDQKLKVLSQRIDRLRKRCRRQSVSILVPMGGEMAYRYQEILMADTLDGIKDFRVRMARRFDAPIPDDITLLKDEEAESPARES